VDVVRERCRAKLNLFLDVVGKRADGFHDLVTVFHEIDLADDLHARALPDATGRVELKIVFAHAADQSAVPTDATNLAVRAASALLRESGSTFGVQLTLTKIVPTGGGLGGGSADAAGALRAVNRLLRLGADDASLERIALTLGSDVPFLVRGGTAVGRGRGEILERIDGLPKFTFGLAKPVFGTSTAAVYREVSPPYGALGGPDAVIEAIRSGDARRLASVCRNALEAPAVRAEPRMGECLAAARSVFGGAVHMTGSGSTLFVPTSGAGNWVFPDVRDEFGDVERRCRLFRGFTLNC
jgi:4-diphosphocytidyl-2-C-methyl-D-erythritol kinase